MPPGGPQPNTELGGGNVRGDTDFDVTILKIDLNVPANKNCLSFTFRFYSAEFPQYVGTDYNDAFIAELDTSNWTTSGSTISAPNNFAKDINNRPISINATGAATMSRANAAGTIFANNFNIDPYSPYGATPLLQANTPITPGAHSLYLSIFDQGDRRLDSAVFIDRLFVGNKATGACVPGVSALPDVVLSKTFSPTTISEGGTSTLTFTITNNVGNPGRGGLRFTDTLPTGLEFVSLPESDCAGLVTYGSSNTQITLQGGILFAGDPSCTITATVKANTFGAYSNTDVNISQTYNVDEGEVDATLTVTSPNQFPRLTKQFIRRTIGVGGVAELRFTITNSVGNPASSNIGFTDTLPANLTVLGVPNANQCGGVLTGNARNIGFTGGTLSAGQASCTISLNVTSTVLGTYVNNTSNISAVTGNLQVDTVNATLYVVTNAALTKTFTPSTITLGGTSTLKFTITNGTGNPFRTDMDFTDTLPANVTVSGTPVSSQCGGTVTVVGGNVIQFRNGQMNAGQTTCTINVTVTSNTQGTYTNNAANITDLTGALTDTTANATLNVVGPEFRSTPPTTQTVVVGGMPNRTIQRIVTIQNVGAVGSTLNVTFVSQSNPSVFTISGLPMSVAQGTGGKNIFVRCQPIPGADRTGTLTVQTNEPGNPQYTFNLACRPLPHTVGVFRPSVQFFYMRFNHAGGFASLSVPFGAATDLPIIGEWNNDGIEAVGVFSPATNRFQMKNANSPTTPVLYDFVFGQAGDLPIAGDWDGDGRDSIGVYRPSTGQFFLRNSLTAGPADYVITFGPANMIPIAGDWDGDGTDGIGYFNPATTRWYVSNTICASCTATQFREAWFGVPSDRIVVGDWDANGTTDIGVFRPSKAIFYLTTNGFSGARFPNIIVPFGLAADLPIAGVWSDLNNTSTASAPSFVPKTQ